MQLSLRALAITCGLVGAGCLLMVGLCNAIWPSYGVAFLQVFDSIYPGYHASTGIGNLIVGSLYALIDCSIGGLIFGWLYNRLA